MEFRGVQGRSGILHEQMLVYHERECTILRVICVQKPRLTNGNDTVVVMNGDFFLIVNGVWLSL